jgi:hypothetical protein
MTSSLTTLGNFAAYWWYQSFSGMFGVAHVPGHGPGVEAPRPEHVVAVREGHRGSCARARTQRARTLLGGAERGGHLRALGAQRGGLRGRRDDRELPLGARRDGLGHVEAGPLEGFGLMWLTRYWFRGCGRAASALAGMANAVATAATKSVLRKLSSPGRWTGMAARRYPRRRNVEIRRTSIGCRGCVSRPSSTTPPTASRRSP